MTRLGELVAINPRSRGIAEPRSMIGLADIDALSATAQPRAIEGLPAHRRVAFLGDVLFAQISPSMENGKLAIVPDTGSAVLVSTELMVLSPERLADGERIWAFLRREGVRKALGEYMVGTARRRLGREVLEAVEIPDVPAGRWAVAAEVLRHLDQAVLLRRRIFADLHGMVGAAFAKAAHGQERVRLGDVADVASGLSESASEEGSVRLIRAANLDDGSVVGASGFVPEGIAKAPLLERDDLLVARTGGALGNAAVYEGDPPGASFGIGLARVRGHFLPGDFLWGWLQSAEARRGLEAGVSGSAVSSLALAGLADLRVPAPGPSVADLAAVTRRVRLTLRAARVQLELLEIAIQAHLANVFGGSVRISVAGDAAAPVDEEILPAMRPIFDRASPAQREIWIKATRMSGPFRVRDLIDSEFERAMLQHTLSMLEQLGVLICERDGVIATWRLPHPEEDLIA